MVVSPLLLPAAIHLQPASANLVPDPVYAGPRGYLSGPAPGTSCYFFGPLPRGGSPAASQDSSMFMSNAIEMHASVPG